MYTSTKFVAFGLLVALSGCTHKNHDMAPVQPELNINYPAAYVVNAESNSLSVIDLATNKVKETISFGAASTTDMTGMKMNEMVMWPHHIYLSPDGNKLGVGAGYGLERGPFGCCDGYERPGAGCEP
jgi:YVTN family beta-propeller protein